MITWTEEQNYIIRYDRPANLLVSAAAGSGKTAVLTERIVQRALAKKIRLPHLLVMTFTELAAKQMKQRIAARFREVRKEDANTLLQELPLAQISTVHAFCNQVLSAHLDRYAGKDGNPLLEPGYRVADETLSKTLLDQSLDNVISTLNTGLDAVLRKTDPHLLNENVARGLPEEESPSPFILTGEDRTVDAWYKDYRSLSLAFAPGLTDVPFREAITSMLHHLHHLPHYEKRATEAVEQLFAVAEAFPSDDITAFWWDRFENAYVNAKSALDDLRQTSIYASFREPKTNPIRQLKAATLAMESVIDQLSGPHDRTAERWDAIARAGASLDELKFPPYMAKSANESILERNRYLVRFWQDVLPLAGLISDRTQRTERLKPYLEGFPPVFTMSTEELRRDLLDSSRVTARFIEVVLLVDADYRKRRFSDNIILFSDIEHGALALLEQEDIGARYRNHFDEIYVDEYQDTSSIQDAILETVGRDNVFMVGDVKQSIYRFRYANPKLFTALADASELISPEKKTSTEETIQNSPPVIPEQESSTENIIPITSQEKPEHETDRNTPAPESFLKAGTKKTGCSTTTPHEGAGYLALLSRNFRSRPGILEFINDFFSAFLTRESGDIEYDETQTMTPVRPVSESDKPPVVLSVACMTDENEEDLENDDENGDRAPDAASGLSQTERDDAGVTADILARPGLSQTERDNASTTGMIARSGLSQTEQEAVMAADIIQDLLANGAAPESIAVLLPTNDNCRVYGDILKAYHIPIVTRTGPVFPDNPVTRQVEALLALLDNPLQDIPLINTLMGPFVLEPFTEEELVELAGTATLGQDDSSDDIDRELDLNVFSEHKDSIKSVLSPSETIKTAMKGTQSHDAVSNEVVPDPMTLTVKNEIKAALIEAVRLDRLFSEPGSDPGLDYLKYETVDVPSERAFHLEASDMPSESILNLESSDVPPERAFHLESKDVPYESILNLESSDVPSESNLYIESKDVPSESAFYLEASDVSPDSALHLETGNVSFERTVLLESMDKATTTITLRAEQEKERSFHRRFQAVAEGEESICQTIGTDLSKKVARFSKTLERWRFLAQELPARELIDTIFSETDYEAIVATFPRSEHYAADLDMLKELLEGEPGAPLPNLREALKMIREAREQTRSIPSSESALLPGAVHVLTRHSSKGLQWDHVILGGLFRSNERQNSNAIITFSEQQGLSSCTITDGGLAVYNNPLHERAASLHKRDAQAESWRLLYVSMTRAKERLFLLLPAKKTIGDIGRVANIIDRVNDAAQTMTREERKQRAALTTELAAATGSDAELILSVLALHDPIVLDAMIHSEGAKESDDKQDDDGSSRIDSEKTQDGASDFGHGNLDFKRDCTKNKQDGDFPPREKTINSSEDKTSYRGTAEKFTFENAAAYVERWIDIYKRVEERASSLASIGSDDAPSYMTYDATDKAALDSEKAFRDILMAKIPREDAAHTPAKISVTEIKRLREAVEATQIAAEGEFADAPIPIYTGAIEHEREESPSSIATGSVEREGAPFSVDTGTFERRREGAPFSVDTGAFERRREGAPFSVDTGAFERRREGVTEPVHARSFEHEHERTGAHDMALTMRRREKDDLIKGVALGTVLHTVFQFLDIEPLRNASEEEGTQLYLKQLDDLRNRNVLEPAEYKAAVPFSNSAILWAKSDLAGRILAVSKTTGKVYREMPFTLAVPSKTLLSSWPDDEMTLVQGMIDLWFVEENGDAILIDFKSDRLPGDDKESVFKERYGFQLQTYAKAIERATGRTVRERILWLIRAGRGLVF